MIRKIAVSAVLLTAALRGQSAYPLLTIDTIKVVQVDTDRDATLQTSVTGGVFNYTLTTLTTTIGLRTGRGSFTIVPPTVRGSDGPTLTFDSPATFVLTQTYDSVLTVGATVSPDIGPSCDARQFKTFNCPISRLAIENTPSGRRAYVDATLQVSIVSGSQIRLRIYFFLDAPPPVCSDVTIDHTEVVQVVQDPQNSILLIQRKPTVARVFVTLVDTSGGQPLAGVTGILRGFRDGLELEGSPLNIFGGTVTARGSFQRDSIGESLNFELPLAWTSGPGLELRPEVKVPSCGGSEAKQVTSRTVVDFSNARAQGRTKLRIGWIPFCHQQPPDSFGATFSLVCPDEATIPALDYELRKVYPLPPDDVELTQINVPKTTRSETFTVAEEEQFLNSISKTYLASEGRFFDHLVAMIPLSKGLNSGRAILQGKVFYVAISAGSNLSPDDPNSYIGFNSQTVAHELGHNLGRLHTGGLVCTFNGSTETSKAYPWIASVLNQWGFATADIQEVGFDVDLRKVVQANRGELMSYCSLNGVPDWISPFTYKALADTGLATGRDSSNLRTKAAASEGTQVLLSGWAARDGSGGGLDPAYQVVSGDEPPVSQDAGTHCLRFSGSNGTSDFCFSLSFLNTETLQDTEREYFVFKAPMPAGTNRVALISRNNGDAELASSSSASGAPSLTITSPVAGDRWDGGTRTVAWTASDPDGGRVTSSVLYSADGGGSWLPLALDLKDSKYTFEIARLQGGRDVRFRVMASSGLSSTTLDVGPIEIVERPTIVSSTTQVDFLTQAVGQDAEQTFMISNSGSGTLVLNSARLDNGAFTVSRPAMPIIVPGGSATNITVRWRVESAGAQTGTLTIASNDTSRPLITVAVRGNASSAAGTPLIAVNPSTLDFGSLAAGQSKTLDLVVSNNGSGPLTVKSVSASGTKFTVLSSALPAVVPAFANLTMQVRFQPTSAGASAEVLTLGSNDPRQPNFTVPLRGTGTATEAAPVLEVRAGNPSTAVTVWDFGTVSTSAPAISILLQVINKTSSTVTVAAALVNSKFTLGSPAASTFNIASGAFENAQIFFRPTDNTVQSGSVTFTANGQSVTIVLRGTGTVSGGSTTSTILAVDGGSYGATLGYPAGVAQAYFVNRLTPPSYPATLRSVQIAIANRNDSFALGDPLTVLTAANPSGSASINGISFTRTSRAVTALGQFNSYDIAPLTIQSGDFVVGFSAVEPPGKYLAQQDVASGSKQRSYLSPDGANFSLTDSFQGLAGNWGIRATVDLAGSNGGGGGTSCVAAPSNLVSWWRGDGNAGDAVGGNTGRLEGGASFGPGEVGQAFQFDGATGDVSLGDPASLRLTAGLTIEGWVKARSLKAQTSGPPMGAILTKWSQVFADSPDSDSYGLWLIQNGTTVNLFSAIHQPGAQEPHLQGGTIPLNTWTHVAATFEAGGQYLLYVNGQQVASGSFPGTIFPTSHTVLIGREASYIGRAFDGWIDEMSVYSRALSEAELQAIIAAGSAGKCATGGSGGGGGATANRDISVTPNPLDFGTVPLAGSGRDTAVTIRNGNASAKLTILGITGVSAPYSVVLPTGVSLPFDVQPNASVQFTVHFAPTANGTVPPQTMQITSNDVGTPSVPVAISGSGGTAGGGGSCAIGAAVGGLPSRPTCATVDPSQALASNLVGLFLMNEGQGPTDLNVVNGQTATLKNATWTGTDPSVVFSGGASSASYLDAGTDPAFDRLPTSKMTIVAKVFVAALPSRAGIAEKNDGNSADGFLFGMVKAANGANGNLMLTVEYSGSNMRVLSDGDGVKVGKWNQLAVTWDGTVGGAANARLYINGVEQAKAVNNNGSGSLGFAGATNKPFRIGTASFDDMGSLNGRIAYLAVYRGRILSAAEIGQLDARLPIK